MMKKLLMVTILFATTLQITHLDAHEHCAVGLNATDRLYATRLDGSSDYDLLLEYTCQGHREPLHLSCSEGFIGDNSRIEDDKYRYRCIKRELLN